MNKDVIIELKQELSKFAQQYRKYAEVRNEHGVTELTKVELSLMQNILNKFDLNETSTNVEETFKDKKAKEVGYRILNNLEKVRPHVELDMVLIRKLKRDGLTDYAVHKQICKGKGVDGSDICSITTLSRYIKTI